MDSMHQLSERLSEILPAFAICKEEPLAKHTSFRIGGAAEIMVFPRSSDELSSVLKAAKDCAVKPWILGAGTNVLAPDEGVRGLVICLKETFMGLSLIQPNIVEAMAGMTLAQTAMFAARNNLSGMECLHGIPGTVGGGVYMNAGAYGGEIKDVAIRTEFMDLSGETQWFEGDAQAFGYRKSAFQNLEGVIVRTQFALKEGVEREIRAKIYELNEKRRASQPLDKPSAGSTFKRPDGYFAGTLIDQAGLRGLTVGGAQVSQKHAGFVVNIGGATAADVLELIEQVQAHVYAHSGVQLEPEVRLWGQK